VSAPAIVTFTDVVKHFPVRRGLFGQGAPVKAVDGVSFSVQRGRVLGLAGESGSGKSTIANLLVGLEQPNAGAVTVDGRSMTTAPARAERRAVQMVFQDPFGSLNPRFTLARTVEEPLLIHGIGSPASRRQDAIHALEKAELRPGISFLDRYPHELSGGQRQRVAIARAIVLGPKLLVADEPVSMLDVSIRAGILRLLRRLVTESDMAMVFITHDLSIVAHICDDLAVMYRGRIVEQGPVRALIERPAHPYTQALTAAVPIPDPAVAPHVLPAKLSAAAGATHRGEGCAFSPRCPRAIADCERIDPGPVALGPGHAAACLRLGEPAGALA
jgi:peptide/nickel transport system ATP-binding protein